MGREGEKERAEREGTKGERDRRGSETRPPIEISGYATAGG